MDNENTIVRLQMEVMRRSASLIEAQLALEAKARTSPGLRTNEEIQQAIDALPPVTLTWLCELSSMCAPLTFVGEDEKPHYEALQACGYAEHKFHLGWGVGWAVTDAGRLLGDFHKARMRLDRMVRHFEKQQARHGHVEITVNTDGFRRSSEQAASRLGSVRGAR